MKKLLFFIFLFSISITSYSQDVFDIGIRKIEIFFSEPNWDDTLDVYYANDLGQRLLADSVIIDGVRSPIGLKNGNLMGMRSDDLSAQVVSKLLENSKSKESFAKNYSDPYECPI